MTINERNHALPIDLIEALAEAGPPATLAPERAAAIKADLMDRVRAERTRFVTVRANDGEWVKIAPLAHVKVLHDDGRRRSCLLRLAPGARVPAHGHAADETCIVLEGSAALGDVEVHAGDFHLAAAGSVHGEITSRTGALLFLSADTGVRRV
jgi:quercetin dioxygenase-like cupin family protein